MTMVRRYRTWRPGSSTPRRRGFRLPVPRPRCPLPASRFRHPPARPCRRPACRSPRPPVWAVAVPRRRPAPHQVAVPARRPWAVVHRWVEGRASPYPVPVAHARVVVPAHARVVVPAAVPAADRVVVPGADQVVVPAVVVHLVERGDGAAAAKNSSRWTFPPIPPMTRRCPRAKWWWSVPPPPRTSAPG